MKVVHAVEDELTLSACGCVRAGFDLDRESLVIHVDLAISANRDVGTHRNPDNSTNSYLAHHPDKMQIEVVLFGDAEVMHGPARALNLLYAANQSSAMNGYH